MGTFERYRRRFPGHRVHFFGPCSLRDEIRRLFTEFSPDVDIIQNGNNVRVRVELPDVRKEDLEVSLRNNLLVIKGKKRSEKEENKYYVERRFGDFCRTLALPVRVKPDGVTSTCKDGVLEIVLLKKEEDKSKEIKISLK